MKALLIVAAASLLLFAGKGFASKTQTSAVSLLVEAKFTGACGVLDSLINFQSRTQMPGGDAFVARFWATEAARLGLNVKQLSAQCDSAILGYEQTLQQLGGIPTD